MQERLSRRKKSSAKRWLWSQETIYANHNLGELFVQSEELADAAPYLEKAQEIHPGSYDNGYDLGQAYFLTGRLTEARQTVQELLKLKNTAELHNLLAQIEEKDGKFLIAANEYEVAAHLEPSEENLFDWGSEFLLHRTYEPAIDVFEQATRRYPNSPRSWSVSAWRCIPGANMTRRSRRSLRRPI